MPGVKRERADAVGVLTLDEPATLNAMTPDLLGDLAVAIGEMTDDPQVRALVLTGAGRGFCSGQNLKAAQILGDDIVAGVMRYYWPAFKALRECRVPIVVAVNGVAAGGGFSLAMAGDIIVAARSAKFIQVFSRIALVPDLGSTWMLPRLVGRQRALELMLSNEPLAAERAKEWGLVRQVFDDAALLDGALTLARKLADGPTRALVATRRLLEESEHATYADQFRRERGFDAIAYGVNVDDQGDFRPGQRAALQHHVAAPLLMAGLTKADIRQLAQAAGLRVWDKPASACLSSRIEYGRPVTREALGMVERGEDALRELGFRVFRVRHHGEVVRLEIALDELPRALDAAMAAELTRIFKALGFRFVTLDLEGFRSGSMNSLLTTEQLIAAK